MNSSEEEVYELVGRQDKTATVSFKIGSDSYNLYGNNVTVLFLYTQFEREELDNRIKNPNNKTTGRVRARFLLSDLDKKKFCNLKRKVLIQMIYIQSFILNMRKETLFTQRKQEPLRR